MGAKQIPDGRAFEAGGTAYAKALRKEHAWHVGRAGRVEQRGKCYEGRSGRSGHCAGGCWHIMQGCVGLAGIVSELRGCSKF